MSANALLEAINLFYDYDAYRAALEEERAGDA
jgi:hypothetical protein